MYPNNEIGSKIIFELLHNQHILMNIVENDRRNRNKTNYNDCKKQNLGYLICLSFQLYEILKLCIVKWSQEC